MEWRIFLPHGIDTSILPSTDARHEKLQACLEMASRDLVSTYTMIPAEERDDSYIVMDGNCGLKYRNGKKLEIKIKLPLENAIGVEHWTKYKLKKKEVQKQKQSILALLTEHGYDDRNEEYDRRILACEFVEIHKKRRKFMMGAVSLEICQIDILNSTHHPQAAKSWTSIAVEGDDISSIQGVLSSASFKMFFQVVSEVFHEDYKHVPIQPIVCGYPFWVQYVTGKYSAEEFATFRRSKFTF